MSWIWLDPVKYPEIQENYPNINGRSDGERRGYPYAVALFRRSIKPGAKITSVSLTVSADSFYQLFVNGKMIGIGPAAAGGDFLCTGSAPKHYSDAYEIKPNAEEIAFLARVRLCPERLTDYSRGHGGFMLSGKLRLEDGTELQTETDEAWEAAPDTACIGELAFDSTVPGAKFAPAVVTEDRWHAGPAAIPTLSFSDVLDETCRLGPGESAAKHYELDKIWGVYPVIESTATCELTLRTGELPGQPVTEEKVRFGGPGCYYSFRMHSAGYAGLEIKAGDKAAAVRLQLRASYYPISAEGTLRTSDEALDQVVDVCRHTLKICRQTEHLDSTTHQELLACTGDYYIETLMTLYAYGDLRLAEADVRRTADWLAANDGRMFHTTYSLIWVQMLYDVYTYTGDRKLVENSEQALDTLLKRFRGYLGESGVLESPPDFMFVDWTVIDGYSMHHPPKALGQTVLNCFWYKALRLSAELYALLGRKEKAGACTKEAALFHAAFNSEFYDREYGLYFDGKNEAYGPDGTWLPGNSTKRYYSKYPNILAGLYGLIEGPQAAELLQRVLNDDSMQDIQPYFMHFALEAVRKLGLFGTLGFRLLERWKPLVKDCPKGLAEGWIAPEEGYRFDHSHAWGGTPAWQLPQALTGMEVLEPGMKRLRFTPRLYGLSFAEVSFPTPLGEVYMRLEKGREPVIVAEQPFEVCWEGPSGLPEKRPLASAEKK